MRKIFLFSFFFILSIVGFLYLVPNSSNKAFAVCAGPNGVTFQTGDQYCSADSYPGNGPTVGTVTCSGPATVNYRTCQSDGTFSSLNCPRISGTQAYCGYVNSKDVGCFTACNASVPTATPTLPPGTTATPTPTTAIRWACRNNACVQDSTGPYTTARACSDDCATAPPPPATIQCPKCNSPFILNDSKTVCYAGRKTDTLTNVTCPDIGGTDVSCKGSGTQGGCVASSGTTTNPECYINIPGYCDEQTGEQKLECDGASCDTALGNFNTKDVGGFVGSLFTRLLGIVGGVAILLIIISGYRIMTSRGNPEQVQHAREQLTAAVVGLLFVVFSLVALQVIGYDILRLPGFSP